MTFASNHPKALLLKGLPGSGKSTEGRLQLEEWRRQGFEPVVLNKDMMRVQHPDLTERHIEELFVARLTTACQDNAPRIILDNTHLNQSTVNKYLAILNNNGYETEQRFLDVPVSMCVARDNQRRMRDERYVGRSVIIQMALRYNIAVDWNHFIRTYRGKDAVIFDLDGTICDISHRRHHVTDLPEGQKKDWTAFFAGIPNDTPNPAVVDLYSMAVGTGKTIIFVSGRGEEHRRTTELWLENNLLDGYVMLLMRRRGDRRDDVIVKREIYRDFIRPHFNVLWTVDDRNRVVDMWREEGLTCFQCAPGDF